MLKENYIMIIGPILSLLVGLIFYLFPFHVSKYLDAYSSKTLKSSLLLQPVKAKPSVIKSVGLLSIIIGGSSICYKLFDLIQ